jgi:hypothetical protein
MASAWPHRNLGNGRRRAALAAAAVVAIVVMPSCESDTTSPTDVLNAVVQVTVEPNPVPAVQNPLTGSVSASYRITIAELAGLGGEVQFVSSTVYNPADGQQVAVNYFDSTDLTVFVGSNRLEPGGTLAVPQTLSYILPDLGRAASVTVAVQVKDDRQNLINRSLLVPIQ